MRTSPSTIYSSKGLLSNGNKPYCKSVLSQTLSPPQSSSSMKFRLLKDSKTLKSTMCRFKSAFTPTKSSSSRLALLIWQNSSDCSMPANLRSQRLAAIPVVELPLNGSRIQSPLSVQERMIRVVCPRNPYSKNLYLIAIVINKKLWHDVCIIQTTTNPLCQRFN